MSLDRIRLEFSVVALWRVDEDQETGENFVDSRLVGFPPLLPLEFLSHGLPCRP